MEGEIGHKVRLQRADDSSPAGFLDIGEISEDGVDGPGLARDAIDVSHSQSPNRYREFIPGMLDGGEISATLLLKPSATQGQNHQEMIDDLNTATLRQYRMLFPPGASQTVVWTFDGFFTSLGHAVPVADKMTLAFTIKISGQPTLSAISNL